MTESLMHQVQRAEVEQDAAAGRCRPCPICMGLGFHGMRYSYDDVCEGCGRIGFLELDAGQPTDARPGSLQKIGILAKRYDLGYPNLHFEGDVRNVRGSAEVEIKGDEPEWSLPQNAGGGARGHYAMEGADDDQES